MIGFYVMIGLFGVYLACLIGILGVRVLHNEEIRVCENVDVTVADVKRPSYKKKNLRIEIPDDKGHVGKGVKEYWKVIYNQAHCFPLVVFSKGNNFFSRISRITAWFILACWEVYVNSLIIQIESPALSSIVTCLICSPVLIAVKIVFLLTASSDEKFHLNDFFGYFLCLLSFICSLVLASFVDIQETQTFLASCGLILAFEVFLVEPLRTVLKAAGMLICKELGIFENFCKRV